MHLRGRITVFAAASALAVAALGQGGVATAATATPSAAGHHPVPNSTPQWLGSAKHLGAVSTASAVDFRVYLTPRGGTAAVQKAVAAVSTPGSANYRKFLTPATYHSTYDPSASTVASVRSWLASDGLKVRSVAEYNSYLQVSGTAAQAQKAFSTTIARYTHNGMTVQANTTPLTVPAAVAASVLTVTGIDTTPSLMKAQAVAPAPPPTGFNNARPCSQSYGQLTAKFQADYKTPLPKFNGKYLPFAVCGYTGPQLRAAYEGSTVLDGTGVTVGIVDAYQSPTLAADANQYATGHGDGSYLKGQLKQVVPKTFTNQDLCDASGWYGEQSLDVEAVHAMAPAANIRYYGAASCLDSDFLTTITKVVNQNQVQVVSNSYGEPDGALSTGSIVANEAVFMQGALQGISFLFSSGDNGDELANTGIKQSDSSASDPYVTAVGGTSTAIDASGSLAFQTGWGTNKYSLSSTNTWTSRGFSYGAGGGFSTLFNRPAYQNGVVPASAPPGRAVPDVAMDADPTTGMLIGETQTFPDGVHYGEYRIGGTSLASPLFAGMTALLIQHAGGGLGFLNPIIYGQVKAGTFTDVAGKPKDVGNVRVDFANGTDASGGLLYSIRTFNQDSSLTTVPGWDDVTGVGVPNTGWLTSISPTG
ncbi:protease pro-enzyme activation domain-containing protein [Nakamurella sp. PAMC28650]|jgi:subtilase family serine protease|uniref:S53 family peptidase n=1 Tax=Nakamurella sp. PAMC28650 TaxID=2762325 RepID=UPI00164E3F08|nr:S53 family peptidase [Nakamurella sp. PAMC28650]QNK81380.1 S8/S53 family peptidase [Nakamurella sp. PAMC28650]